MKIYTSYYAKAKQLQDAGIVPVGISAGRARFFTGVCYQALAPTREMLKMSDANYDIHFRQILGSLDVEQVLADLAKISADHGGKDIALLCYEKPSDYCHRHDVSNWLNKSNALDHFVDEWGRPFDLYCGPLATGDLCLNKNKKVNPDILDD